MRNRPGASVRCEIGLKSMNLPYVFVSLRDYENEIECVWAKPNDLTLAEQPIKGKMLEGRIRGTILEKKDRAYIVSFCSNGGDEKVITVSSKDLKVL